MHSAPHITDMTIDAAHPLPGPIPAAPAPLGTVPPAPRPASLKPRHQSYSRLVVWSILPMALWFAAANGLAYYFTSRHSWIDLRQEAMVFYSLFTLYAVPWVLTVVTGFMAWGYSLSMYGSGKGTWRAFGVFMLQWLSVWAMTKASIHWHYVYFYTEQFYS